MKALAIVSLLAVVHLLADRIALTHGHFAATDAYVQGLERHTAAIDRHLGLEFESGYRLAPRAALPE